ncbi:MAG: hypothetical protein RIT43_1530 [Bacteroidota bacterium]|jgi:hypothetical protein
MRIIIFFFLFASCGSINPHETILAREFSLEDEAELTLVSKNMKKLKCSEEAVFTVRVNGKSSSEIIISGVGCTLIAHEKKGWYHLRCLCNEINTLHKLNIISRENKKIIATFDLDTLWK